MLTACLVLLVAACLLLTAPTHASAAGPTVPVGAARVDITPDEPVRLSGYGVRRHLSDGVSERIAARAVAIGGDSSDPAVLVSVENVGLLSHVTDEVAARLKRVGVPREMFAATFTHTHYAPCLTGAIPWLFGEDIPAAHQATIDRYTDRLTDAIEAVALEALANRAPARLQWAQGSVAFAANRRTDGGPVDHRLPVLRAVDERGAVRCIWLGYACHCTTFSSDLNRISGDWAGYAQDAVERAQPAAVALATIGCGADVNPHPRGEPHLAKEYGHQIAGEVARLMGQAWEPIDGHVVGRFERIDLPFDRLPSRDEWTQRTAEPGATRHHAHRFSELLDRGRSIPETLSYPIQSWSFGKDLAVLFLAGEVVVDYALSFSQRYGRLWTVAYANEIPGYIPSERVLSEGGYEGGDAMIYFGQPTRFAGGVEGRIVDTVDRLLPETFRRHRGADAAP